MVDEVNQICNETVHTILLQSSSTECPSPFAYCGHQLNLTDRYKWGEIIPVADYCNQTQVWNSTLHPSIIVVEYSDDDDVFSINLTNCRPYGKYINFEPKLIKKYGISDTRVDKTVNNKGAVLFWEKVTRDRNYEYIINQAFDTYSWLEDESELSMYTNGWWYLKKDPGTTNTSQFIFEEKVKVVNRVDDEENPKYLPWYRDEKFDKFATGILFQGDFPNVTSRETFCRLLSLYELDDLSNVVNHVNNLVKFCGKSFQLYLLRNNLSLKDRTYLQIIEDHITMLIPVDQYILPKGYIRNYPESIKELGYKYGYYIDIDYCGQYNVFSQMSKNILNDIFADKQSSIYVFHYEEYRDTVDLGARRMFRIRNVLFEKCKKLVSNSRNTTTEIGFTVKAIHKADDFYESPWAMKNYVKYIDLMGKYAKNYSDITVFLGQDEDRSYDGDYRRTWESVGWYSYNDFVENKGYKPKPKKSLNISKSSTDDIKYSPYFGLSKKQFVILLCSILLVLLSVILISFCFIRRYRRKYQLTYQESKLFFNGQPLENEDGESSPNSIPYDKAKYEVSENNFKIDTNGLLGSGEFGKVYRGTVINKNTDIHVAVKTTNPQKFHRSMLMGLLSEIKALSYVGQHQNIVKLLGANTSSLKIGKVYVFLELCHLGSLGSYLQKIRTSEPLTVPRTETDPPEPTNKYVNLNTGNNYILDASLSDDLYRWSTEICNGMEYLAEKQVVHADLATRNVLLNLQREAKICDFGLSRRMYNYTSYVKSQQEPLPWRWLAPEALRYMQFNEKTDLWAFGITIWEIYSLGSLPYAGLSWDVNFVRMLEGGLVPAEPDFEEKNMYNIMQKCWKILPDERPTFCQISSLLMSSNAVADST